MFLMSAIWSYATVYYVTPTGNNGNTGTGTSNGTAWATLTYAASSSSPVTAGDVIWIKAGSYGNEIIIFQHSGTAAAPIIYQGYQSSPGDEPPICVDKANPFASFSSTDMPTYTGLSRSSGAVCITAEDVSYVTIKNIQITNYSYGIISGKADTNGYNHFYNIEALALGNTTSGYSGIGFRLGSSSVKFADYNVVEKCMAVNCCAEGITIYGDHNLIKYCEAWSDEQTGTSPMDYYITVSGSNNIFDHCLIDRPAGLTTGGYHGFSVKSNAEEWVDQGLPVPHINPQFNQFLYCTAVNNPESFTVRHRWSTNNLFYKCEAYGTHTGAVGSGAGEGIGIVMRDGASYNLYYACLLVNLSSAIKFLDTVEDGDTGGSPPGHPGHSNQVVQCIINNCYSGIEYSNTGIPSDAGDNLIGSCTFYRPRYCIRASRSCDSIKNVGNIFYGCASTNPNVGVTQGFVYDNGFGSDVLAAGALTYFKDCLFYSIQTGMPGGFTAAAVGSVTTDPLFLSAVTNDFHLTSSSPCINAGTHIQTQAASFPWCQHWIPGRNLNIFKDFTYFHWRARPHMVLDYDGRICSYPFDMGAYKY